MSETPWSVVSPNTESSEEVSVPQHALVDGLREHVRRALPSATLLFGVQTVLQAVGLLLDSSGIDSLVLAINLCVGFGLVVLAGVFSRLEVPLSYASPTALGISSIACAVPLMNLVLYAQLLHSVALFLVLAAASLLFLERRWFFALLAGFVLALGVAGGWAFGTQQWPYYSLAVVSALGTTIWMFTMRYSVVRALTYSLLQDEKRREALQVRVDDAFRSSAELLELTVRDPLTGAYNRRFLAQLRADLESEGRGWGALLIDLDGFKEINDRHGHEVGDRALQRMAHFIGRQARSEDRLVRYGGDEFLLLLEVESEEAVVPIADRFREVASREAPLAFSMGAVGRRPGESLRRLLQRVDKAMYADKASDHSYQRLDFTIERVVADDAD